MIEHVPLGELVAPADSERAGSREFTVLSMTSSAGLVPQASIFKKTIASRDLSSYKVVRPNQLVVGIHVDEGALGFSGANQVGIVSPAYTIWKLRNASVVHIPYLDRFVRSPQAIAYFISNYRETAERRGKLTHDQFLALSIPFPPLSEQRRIATLLDQADALRAKRREALAELDKLSQAIFIEMFGDPATNPKGWPRKSIQSVCASPDDIKCGPFGTQLSKSEVTEAGIPLWGIKNVNAAFQLPAFEFLHTNTASRLKAYNLAGGDIVMTRKGTVGNCAVYPDNFPEGVMHSDLLRIRTDTDLCLPVFLSHQLHHSKDVEHQLTLISGGAVMPGINVTKLKSIEVLVPPVELQKKFAERSAAVDDLKEVGEVAKEKLGTLFQSLQHRAFRGEL